MIEITDSSRQWYDLFERLVEAMEVIADALVLEDEDDGPEGPEGLRAV